MTAHDPIIDVIWTSYVGQARAVLALLEGRDDG